MKLIESINLSAANIPVRSSEDFILSFHVSSPALTQVTREKLGKSLQQFFPTLKYSTWGDNEHTVAFSLAEKDHPGICKHFVDMFRNAGIEVMAMGRGYEEHPLFSAISAAQNLPEYFKTVERFEDFIARAVDKITVPEKPAVLKGLGR